MRIVSLLVFVIIVGLVISQVMRLNRERNLDGQKQQALEQYEATKPLIEDYKKELKKGLNR